jgi:hypothetical protein
LFLSLPSSSDICGRQRPASRQSVHLEVLDVGQVRLDAVHHLVTVQGIEMVVVVVRYDTMVTQHWVVVVVVER